MPNQDPSSQELTLPPEASVSSLMSPARDQGQRGTCVALAVTALHESRRAADTSAMIELSEETLYWGAKQADKNRTSGTSFRSAHLALGKWGQPQAGLWPYDPLRADAAECTPPPEAIDPGNCYFARLKWVPVDVVAVKAHLAAGRAVAVSVEMSTGFFVAEGGKVPVPQPKELISENHAILLTGYRDSDEIFLFRNSWGVGWGDSGYGQLPYRYLTLHGKSACTVELPP